MGDRLIHMAFLVALYGIGSVISYVVGNAIWGNVGMVFFIPLFAVVTNIT